MIDIFFDSDFVPHAYVDILLNSQEPTNFKENEETLQQLLGTLDTYNKQLTRELNSNISQIELLCSSINGNNNSSDNDYNNKFEIKDTKVEYYMDTLSSAVRNIEQNLKNLNIEQQQDNNNDKIIIKNVVEDKIIKDKIKIEGIEEYTLIKKGINDVIDYLKDIENLFFNNNNIDNKIIDIELFQIKLNEIEININEYKDNNNNEKELHEKVLKFNRYRKIFQGLGEFEEIYNEFVERLTNDIIG